jgi:hypothetical protein
MRTLSRSKKKSLNNIINYRREMENTDDGRKEISDFINKQQEKNEKKRDKQHAEVMI